MEQDTLKTCPVCGKNEVQVVERPSEAKSVFSPLPHDWQEAERMYECNCGWNAQADGDGGPR